MYLFVDLDAVLCSSSLRFQMPFLKFLLYYLMHLEGVFCKRSINHFLFFMSFLECFCDCSRHLMEFGALKRCSAGHICAWNVFLVPYLFYLLGIDWSLFWT